MDGQTASTSSSLPAPLTPGLDDNNSHLPNDLVTLKLRVKYAVLKLMKANICFTDSGLAILQHGVLSYLKALEDDWFSDGMVRFSLPPLYYAIVDILEQEGPNSPTLFAFLLKISIDAYEHSHSCDLTCGPCTEGAATPAPLTSNTSCLTSDGLSMPEVNPGVDASASGVEGSPNISAECFETATSAKTTGNGVEKDAEEDEVDAEVIRLGIQQLSAD